MARILLIYPAFTEVYGNFKHAARLAALWPPTGLAYLASSLIEKGHEVKIIDMELEMLTLKKLGSTIRQFKPDIVGITSFTPNHHAAIKVFDLVKSIDSGIITVCGGPHSTALPKETLQECKNIDLLCFGEGELTFSEIADRVDKGENDFSGTAGLFYMKNGKATLTKSRALIEDIDTLPFPARYLLKYKEYLWSVPKKGIIPITTFATSRGCPFRCSFCAEKTMFGNSIRYRSVDNVLGEIKEIVEKYKIRHLSIVDDTLGLNKKRTYKLCDALIREKLDITFEGTTRVNVVNKEFLMKMKKAGLNRLSFGVESGNQNILDAIKKDITLDQIRQAYKAAGQIGLETKMSIIFGLPFETENTVKNTIKFMKSLDCMQANVNIGTPFPGTEYYNMAKNGYGGLKLLTTDWREYRRWGNAVISVNNLSRDDLIKWQRKAMLSFYLRPRQIVYNLSRSGFNAAVTNMIGFLKSFMSKS